METPPKKQGIGRRYTKEEIRRVVENVKLAITYKPGMSYAEIASSLNARQIPHPNRESWRATDVGNFLYRHPVRIRSSPKQLTLHPSPDNVSKPNTNGDRVDIAEIILASSMDKNEKERILKVMFSRT